MAIAGTNEVTNDEKDMKDSASLSSPAGAPAARGGAPQREGKEDWIGRQLRRVFDDALNEPLPDDIMSLLERIDEHPTEPTKPESKNG